MPLAFTKKRDLMMIENHGNTATFNNFIDKIIFSA